MLGILSIIPGIFSIIENIIGPIFSATHKSSILSSIFSGGWDGSSGGLMGIIQNTITGIEAPQLAEIKAQVETLLAQSAINQVDAKSESFLNRGWRPTFAWGLVIIILFHLGLLELGNILSMFQIYTVGQMAPLDTLTTAFMFGLLGIYTKCRTDEKLNSNAD